MKINKDEAITQIREMLEKAGIPKNVVEEWMKNPRAAAEQQKTDILIMLKDKMLEIQGVFMEQQKSIIEMQKQINQLNAWRWRQEGK